MEETKKMRNTKGLNLGSDHVSGNGRWERSCGGWNVWQLATDWIYRVKEREEYKIMPEF